MMSRKKIFIILLTLISLLFALPSCGNTLKLKNDADGNLVDDVNGRYYIYCLGYLKAAEIKKNIYAKGDQGEKLYEIVGIDPAKWLSENITTGIPFLFREQSEEEPTLDEFETQVIHVTETEEVTIRIALIDGREDIDGIVNDFLNNEQTPFPDGYITEDLTFNFESEKYKGIYYVLQYIVDDKGNKYLFDRWTNKCVPCGFNLFGGNNTEDTVGDDSGAAE